MLQTKIETEIEKKGTKIIEPLAREAEEKMAISIYKKAHKCTFCVLERTFSWQQWGLLIPTMVCCEQDTETSLLPYPQRRRTDGVSYPAGSAVSFA